MKEIEEEKKEKEKEKDIETEIKMVIRKSFKGSNQTKNIMAKKNITKYISLNKKIQTNKILSKISRDHK